MTRHTKMSTPVRPMMVSPAVAGHQNLLAGRSPVDARAQPEPLPQFGFCFGDVRVDEGSATVQRKIAHSVADASPHETLAIAQMGISGGGSPLPHLEQIQQSFGPSHTLSNITAHIGGNAAVASKQIGALAYTAGSAIAFREAPSLYLAAHEAAHVIQQRSGVCLSGGIGQPGDRYEQQADAVAMAVERGGLAGPLLAGFDETRGLETTALGVQLAPQPTALRHTEHIMPEATDAVNVQPGKATWAITPMVGRIRYTEEDPLVLKDDVHPTMDTFLRPDPEGIEVQMAEYIETVEASNEIFLSSGPMPDDVQQGGIGDCFDLATIIAIVASDPEKIRQRIKPTGDGGATATLWALDKDPTASVLEKAFRADVPVLTLKSYTISGDLMFAKNARKADGARPFGAQLRADTTPKKSTWWSEIAGHTIKFFNHKVYDLARWVPLMEKAHAAHAEQFGPYGKFSEASESLPGGYSRLEGGFGYKTLFVYYGGEALDPAKLVTPLESIKAGAIALVPMLDRLALASAEARRAAPDHPAVVMAGSLANVQYGKLREQMPSTIADPAFVKLPGELKRRISKLADAVAAWPDGWQGEKLGVIRNFCARCTDVEDNSEFIASTQPEIRAAFELILQIRNVGTDKPSGQRGIITNHEYAVRDVVLISKDGSPVNYLAARDQGARTKVADSLDLAKSQVQVQNPHHTNEPSDTGKGGPADHSDDGVFWINLGSFFRQFSSVEGGRFVKA